MSAEHIPKIIWQTHEWEYADLPKHFLATSMTWQNLNPGWQYMYVTASKRADEVEEFDEVLYKLYFFSDKVTQADIWRYVSVYKYGGVYADMDSICKMPLDHLIETTWKGEKLIATKPDWQGYANNANFGAPQKSIVMKLVLDDMLARYKNIDIYEILLSSKSKHDFWDRMEKALKTSWVEYSNVLMENKDLVSFDFTAAEHSEKLKTQFDYDFYVNYYGVSESYLDLASKNDWVTYIDSQEKKDNVNLPIRFRDISNGE